MSYEEYITGLKHVSFGISVFAFTYALQWGLRRLSQTLDAKPEGKLQRTFLMRAMSEDEIDPKDPKPSFSRTAGSVGAFAVAAAFIGICYWMMYVLYYHEGAIENFENMLKFFAMGSALFIPYAFNQIAKIFNPKG